MSHFLLLLSWFSLCLGDLTIWLSQVAQMVKNLPAVQGTWVWSLSWEDPLENRMATHFSIIAWRIPWTEEPSRLYSPLGHKELNTTGWLTLWLLKLDVNWSTCTFNLQNFYFFHFYNSYEYSVFGETDSPGSSSSFSTISFGSLSIFKRGDLMSMSSKSKCLCVLMDSLLISFFSPVDEPGSLFSLMLWILLVHLDLEIFNINMWRLWKWDFPPPHGVFLLLLVGCCYLLVLWFPRQFWWSWYYLVCEEICVPLILGSPVVLTVFLSMFGGKRKENTLLVFADWFYITALLQCLARLLTILPQPPLKACSEPEGQSEVKAWSLFRPFLSLARTQYWHYVYLIPWYAHSSL